MSEEQCLYKSPNHTANLNNMRLNNKWCDLIIKVNEREYHAHKVILAANLKYFDTMLSRDSFQESKDGVVTMECVKEESLEAFVIYAYTGEILLTVSNALDFLELANYLGEDNIKDACIKFLEKHLKTEQACRAYKFSDTVNCQLLKNVAKKIILSNFQQCSESIDFLDFKCEQLVEILSDGCTMPAKSQLKFFEIMMRWIMHAVQERRNRMDDLLNAIDIAKLTADDLLGYLMGNVVDSNDEHGIMRHVMVCYHKNKIQQGKLLPVTAEQKLIIIGSVGYENQYKFQLCDLPKKKWTPLNTIPGVYWNWISTVAVLNDMLYYIGSDNPECKPVNLHTFNPVTKQNTKLQSSSSLLRRSALCACSRFVYLCGGINEDNSKSNQVLKYDPQTNSFETLPPMMIKRSSAAAIFYQDCLYILGGFDGKQYLNSVEKYDLDSKKWTNVPSMREEHSGHAVAILDGKLYACGGFSKNSVEVYDPSTDNWQLVASMNKDRWSFALVAREGKLFAIGGDVQKAVEVYDPRKNEWQMDHELSSGLQLDYFGGGLVQSNCFV